MSKKMRRIFGGIIAFLLAFLMLATLIVPYLQL